MSQNPKKGGKGKAKASDQNPPISRQQMEDRMYQQAMYESRQQAAFNRFYESQMSYDPSQEQETDAPQYPNPPAPRFSRNPQFQTQFETQTSRRRAPPPPPRWSPQTYADEFDEDDANEEDWFEMNAPDNRQFAPLSENEVDDITPQPAPTKCAPTKWTPKEEYFLCEAFLDISEDPKVGNNQKSGGFWFRVVNRLKQLTDRKDVERNEHQCNSKWKDLLGKVNAFAAVYNNLKRSKAPSGTNEADIMILAREEYQRRNKNKAFKHERCWELLRHHPKWLTIPPMDEHTPKRTRVSEESEYSTTPNTEFEFPEPEPPRRKGKNSTSSASVSKDSDEAASKYNAFLDVETERREKYRESKIRLFEERQRTLDELKFKQLQILDKDEKRKDLDDFIKPHDHLTGFALELVLEQKREIAARWGWVFP